MNLLDAVIGVVAVSAAVGGFRLGFVARALSWLGLCGGLVVAAWLVPPALERFSGADPLRLFLVAAVLLLGAAFAGQALGLLVGARLRHALPGGPVRTADRASGAVAGVVGVVLAVWLLLPALAEVPGWPARQARTSAVTRAIDAALPEPPDTLAAIGRLSDAGRFPEVFAGLRAAPRLGPPPTATGLDALTAERVAASVYRVQARSCRRLQEGTGFSAAEGIVVTNAHVVAGDDATSVVGRDGSRWDADVVAFDADRDVAVLAVPGLPGAALALVPGAVGDTGAVFGHPGGGPLTLSPFQVARQVEAVGRDLYDDHDTRRQVLFLAAALEPGDSGGPLVDPDGDVVGLAFAVAPDRDGVAYALTVAEVEVVLAARAGGPVDTGECLE